MATAVEEILRWTSPSPSKRRTATTDTTLAGHAIKAGDKVLVWEGSANRDSKAFDRPGLFEIRRSPNAHWRSAAARISASVQTWHAWRYACCWTSCSGISPRCELAGDPEWTRSNRHTGLRRLEIRGTR